LTREGTVRGLPRRILYCAYDASAQSTDMLPPSLPDDERSESKANHVQKHKLRIRASSYVTVLSSSRAFSAAEKTSAAATLPCQGASRNSGQAKKSKALLASAVWDFTVRCQKGARHRGAGPEIPGLIKSQINQIA
jgi:hypothetical protein